MEQPNKHPKVSVIIPIYNTCHYVQEALESICRQTLTELEIIAIDDGSTDSSRKVVEQVAATDMRIRVYSQANQGQSITRNNGMQYVQGSTSTLWTVTTGWKPIHWRPATPHAKPDNWTLYVSMQIS